MREGTLKLIQQKGEFLMRKLMKLNEAQSECNGVFNWLIDGPYISYGDPYTVKDTGSSIGF